MSRGCPVTQWGLVQVGGALHERATRIYQQYGNVMLEVKGMTKAGIERKATCRALFSKLLYLQGAPPVSYMALVPACMPECMHHCLHDVSPGARMHVWVMPIPGTRSRCMQAANSRSGCCLLRGYNLVSTKRDLVCKQGKRTHSSEWPPSLCWVLQSVKS